MSTYSEKKKEQNRLAQEKYRNSQKGREYMAKWRSEHREEYLQYQRDYSKKRYQALKDASNK